MTPLLQRQIKKHLNSSHLEDPQIRQLLNAVDSSYKTGEEQLVMLQRAMQISSEELFEANEKIRKEAEGTQEVLNSITYAIKALNLKEFKSENGEFEISSLAAYIKEQSEELQKASQQQAKLLDSLEKKNQVLTDYAHMVSHDLKSPLRSINALISWIREDNYDNLNDKARDNFDLILSNVEKMDALINGILNYSTIDQAQLNTYDVDIKYVVEEIIEMLVVPDHIHFKISQDLPVILADKFRIQQLFQNLIQNAVKSIDKTEGLVEINVSDMGKAWKFHIKDNGKGIPERHHGKIFGIFEKIDNDRASTGIGLSIAKKVVDYYGGKIGLESKEGHGSCFYFTIPK